jgi:hypothetical protein
MYIYVYIYIYLYDLLELANQSNRGNLFLYMLNVCWNMCMHRHLNVDMHVCVYTYMYIDANVYIYMYK